LAWAQHLPQEESAQWSTIGEALLRAFPARHTHSVGGNPDGGIVEAFYDQHVYPQWHDLSPWTSQDNLGDMIRTAGQPGKRVLIAGCGTGRWACHFAASFPGAEVLALDVSRKAVAYAREQKMLNQVNNLELQHEDLRSFSPGKTFDFIECGGVLHHLEDPEAAWAHLASMLRPGGVMLVSLYSRAARKPLKQLRSSILPCHVPQPGRLRNQYSMQGIDDGILRDFRQELLQRTWTDERLCHFARSPDFHSLARLHDAFFHPLEVEYDLLELDEMLSKLGLKCLGMDVEPEMLELFRNAMPNRDPKDLYAWHELENRVPELFIGMYQVFVGRT